MHRLTDSRHWSLVSAVVALAAAGVLLASVRVPFGPFGAWLSGWVVLVSRMFEGMSFAAVRPAGWLDLLLVGVGAVFAAYPLVFWAHRSARKPSRTFLAVPVLLVALVSGAGVPAVAELAAGAVGPWAAAGMAGTVLLGVWLVLSAIRFAPVTRHPSSTAMRWSLLCAGVGIGLLVTIPLGMIALLVAYLLLAAAWLRPLGQT